MTIYRVTDGDFQEILDEMMMARAGKGFSYKGFHYEVYVYADEGLAMPHFHLLDPADPMKTATCVRIDVPEYFHHGYFTHTLDSRARKMLDVYMSGKAPNRKEFLGAKTMWEAVRNLWNSHVEDKYKVLIDVKDRPSYRNLPSA